MRKYIYTLICAVACILPAVAQESGIPDAFNCGKAYWVTEMTMDGAPYFKEVMVYRLYGDTVIDGETWKKMNSCKMGPTDIRSMNLDFDNLDFGSPVGCMRNDNGMVYGIVIDGNGFMYPAEEFDHKPLLLYDFSKEAGDSVPIYDFQSGDLLCYKEVGITETGGYERKTYSEYIEGIGHYYSGPFGPLQAMATGFENPILRYCCADGKAVYGSNIREEFKFMYDMFFYSPQMGSLYANPEWKMGRIKDGNIVETYNVSFNISIDDMNRTSRYFASSLRPDEKFPVKYGDEDWDDGKLYCDIDGTQHLLYDFRLGNGETFDNGIRRMTVTSVDTLMIEGFERPVLTFDNGERWIDGLGSTRGLLSPITEDSEEYDEILLSCRAGDTVMYLDPQYGSGLIPVEGNVCEIRILGTNLEIRSCSGSDHIVRLYDAGGSAVVSRTFTGSEGIFSLSSLQGGVYIVTVDGIVCGKVIL